MTEKRISVRLAAVSSKQVRAKLGGVDDTGVKGFGRMPKEAEIANARLDKALIDVSGLWGAVGGSVISALEAPCASISTLARHFGFDAVKSEGRIHFLVRGRVATTTITSNAMVRPRRRPFPVRMRTRRSRHVLAMCPEPRQR